MGANKRKLPIIKPRSRPDASRRDAARVLYANGTDPRDPWNLFRKERRPAIEKEIVASTLSRMTIAKSSNRRLRRMINQWRRAGERREGQETLFNSSRAAHAIKKRNGSLRLRGKRDVSQRKERAFERSLSTCGSFGNMALAHPMFSLHLSPPRACIARDKLIRNLEN